MKRTVIRLLLLMDGFMLPFLARLSKFIIALPRSLKRVFVLVLDLILCVISVVLAYYLRVGNFLSISGPVVIVMVVSVSFALPIFIVSGLYRAVFRYSGLHGMVSLCRAMLLYGVAFSVIFTVWSVDGVPRTVGLIQPILLFLLVGASRATARVWLGGMYQQQRRKASLPQALIYGAGDAGRQLALAMANSPKINVVGFLDDDYRLHGNFINGLPIYNPADFAEVLSDLPVTDVLLALPSVSLQRRREILNCLKPYKVAVRTLPGLGDLATGKVSLGDVRDLDIDDLLGREPVKPNELLLKLSTQGKIVLVTGAGGSIGSELCRQIVRTRPRTLLLLEMCEFALYQIHQELQAIVVRDDERLRQQLRIVDGSFISNLKSEEERVVSIELVPLLASVCDAERMQRIMETWRPHTVYHAAAYKHVPMVEHNPAEGVRNNIWGTRVCAEVALRNKVRNFVLISTDKAVRPTNIMGATKRLSEMVLQALNDRYPPIVVAGGTPSLEKTIFSIVRFGNVLGSSGSVVPMFREQVKVGGPVTLTHLEMTRYFMTIPEAAQLVIQAGAMGQGGDVFVLDMGQPVKIIDLARRVIELSGLTVRDSIHPEGDIELTVIGLRPGEKLYEELLIGDNPEPTQHPRIMKANEPHMRWSDLEDKLNALGAAMSRNDALAIRNLLQEMVKGYQPSVEVVDWVYLAREVKSGSFI
jgi:nucleoside-diphosphate-sugar epimerase